MKTVSAVLGSLMATYAVGSVLGLVVGTFVDTTTATGKSTANTYLGLAGIVLFFGFIVLFRRAASARYAWARAFLWTGIAALAAPLATLAYGASFTARQTDPLSGFGAGAGTGLAAAGISFVSFFLAAILLAIAYALSRGGQPRGRMKRCPRCAEEIQQAAVVCRFCGHEIALPAASAT